MSRDRAPRVFLGRLPRDARERDVEKFFRGFGRIREINLKNGFGFVVSTAKKLKLHINLKWKSAVKGYLWKHTVFLRLSVG